MKSPSLDFFEMLKVLHNHEVEFIVVGGVCAVFHGAPVTTFDLDIVRSCSPGNATRILEALKELDGHSRLHKKIIRPNRTHLESSGHILLQTKYGPLDLLGTAGAGHDFDALIKHSVTASIRDISFPILNIETLIRTKEESGRPKDKMVIPILRATMKEGQN